MTIAVIGTGYVGLVAGVCFAGAGYKTICLDLDQNKVRRLSDGIPTIYEPGLKDLLGKTILNQKIHFTSDYASAVSEADVIFLSVGTPPLPNGEPNLSYVHHAAENIGRHLRRNDVIVVNKSTVPIGSKDVVKTWIESQSKFTVKTVSNPEFLREGSAIEDFVEPARIIIGTDDDSAFQKMRDLYSAVVPKGTPILQMDSTSAEITKYACNAFLSTKISFMNQLSHLCEATGASIEHVRDGMSLDPRIGDQFLFAGAGYGGSCFPKDNQALISTAEKLNVPIQIIRSVEEVNSLQKKVLFQKLKAHFGARLGEKRVALLGLAFKPNTDDVREAPAIETIRNLYQLGVKMTAYDPIAMEQMKNLFPNELTYSSSLGEAVKDTDAIVIHTEWTEFRTMNLQDLKSISKAELIIDGRNILNAQAVIEAGFHYDSIGRKKQLSPFFDQGKLL